MIPLALGLSGLLLAHLISLYRNRPDRVFTARTFVIASGLLYTVPAGLASAFGVFLPGPRTSRIGPPELELAILLSAVFTFLLAVSCLAVPAVRIPLRDIAPSVRRLQKGLLWAGGAIGIAGAVLLAILLSRLGGPNALASIDYGSRFLELRGQGPLRLGVDLLSLTSLTAAMHLISTGRRHRPIAVLILALSSSAVTGWYLLSGIRGPLFRLLVGLGIVWSLKRRPIRPLILVSGSIALVAMSSLLGHWRATGTLAGASLGVLNPARGEFVAPILTTADVLREQASLGGVRFGETYVDAVRGLLPGVLDFDRPTAPSVEYARSLYADFWYRGGAFAFSPVAEAVLNFGPAGVVLVPLIIAFLLSLRIRAGDPMGLGDVPALATAFGLPWILQFFRMDAASAIRAAMYNWALPLTALLLVSGLLSIADRRLPTPTEVLRGVGR